MSYNENQLSLLRNLAAWYLKSPDPTETFVICRKRPQWWFLELQKVEARVWVKGYAATAKALCQEVILIDYGRGEYGITEYGIGILRRLRLLEALSTEDRSQ